MRRRIRVGRALGVDVLLDWSFVLTFALATWTLFSVGARLLPHLDSARLAIAAFAATLGIFGALVLHEVAHGAVLRRCGVPVRRVTLFLLGGITDAERDPVSVKSELAAAILAPLSSVALGLALIVAVGVSGGPMPRDLGDLDRIGAPGVVVLGIGIASLTIAAINMIPAYPLDGGRILRALIWHGTKDVERATRWSAWAGQLVGWLCVMVGVALAFLGHGPGVALGMWVAFIGWFVASAAAQGYETVIGVDVLGDVCVARLMKRSFIAVPVDVSITSAKRTWLECGGDRLLPVVDGEDFIGFFDPRVAKSAETMRDAVVPAQIARPEDTVARHVAELTTHGRLAILDGNRLVGVLDQEDVEHWIDTRGGAAAVTHSRTARIGASR